MIDRIARDRPAIVAMPRVHSLALRMVRTAHGELDAAIAGGNGHDWDLAAADLLVHEAGGTLTALDGRALIYNRPDPIHGVLIAAGRERHAALVELIRAQANEPA
jgi:myo-inositol-1(or 4)-monophosphatase